MPAEQAQKLTPRIILLAAASPSILLVVPLGLDFSPGSRQKPGIKTIPTEIIQAIPEIPPSLPLIKGGEQSFPLQKGN
jgi:hypothetical protein